MAPTIRSYEFGVPWEDQYGYVQAVRAGDLLWVSGQFSHDADGNLVAPAALDQNGRVSSFEHMDAQMRQSYENLGRVLEHFGLSPAHVVEEVLYVLDMDAAFAVAGEVRKAFYGVSRPQVASTVLVTPRLAQPAQLIEIKFVVHT